MLFYPTYWHSCERKPEMVGKKKKSTCIMCYKLSGRKMSQKLPHCFQVLWFFQSAQNVWVEIQTFCNLYKGPKTICSIKIPQMPEKFKPQDFSRVPIFFGQNWKTFNVYDFLDRVKFLKLPGIFPEVARKIFSWILPSIRICWVLKILSKNEKKSIYIISPKFIGQNKISQTGEILSSILENISQEL